MSPVIGLTDEIVPRFPRLGKLRKGGEKTASGFGPDLDHFRFVSERVEIQEAFYEAFGPEPRQISVYLPYETPDAAFPVWAELWGKTGLVHRCDGEMMTIWQDAGKYNRGAKPCSGGHKDNDYRNDAVGRLHLIVPELIQAGFVGYVTLETHSKNDIIGILGVLQAAYNARRDLRGIQFVLRRIQESISTPGWGERKGQRSRTDKWLVRIEPAAEWVAVQLHLARAAQMNDGSGTDDGIGAEMPALTEGDVLDANPVTGEINIPTDEQKIPAPTPPPAPASKPARPAQQQSNSQKVAAQKPANGQRPDSATPEPADWQKWTALCDEANAAGIATEQCEPPGNATLGDLRSAYGKVYKLVHPQ